MSRGDLAATVQRYGQVADAVNRREMKRFIEEVRRRWEPDPLEEWDPKGAGYTDEGAFALCVYKLVFQSPPERHGQLCEAEEKDQVLLHHPPEHFVDQVLPPLAEPAPQAEVETTLTSLRAQLQTQLDQATVTEPRILQLPDDFIELMLMANGIRGAGVPSETAETILVSSNGEHHAGLDLLEAIPFDFEGHGFEALAAWRIGSCQDDCRQVFYVLCKRKGDDEGTTTSWRILDQMIGNSNLYDSVALFLEHETVEIERTPGGAQRRYVIESWFYLCSLHTARDLPLS